MADLPTGIVTFLFTDIEGSTSLWERDAEAMRVALARHDALLSARIERHGGVVIKSRGEGDSIFAVFVRASDAVVATADLQRALQTEPWPTTAPLRVRMALHTGEAELRDGDYYGAAVNRCARLRAAAYGEQVLLSQATRDLASDALPVGAELLDLGTHRLKDLVRPERIFQLRLPGLRAHFPPPRTLESHPNNLPTQLTSLVGREAELDAVRALLRRDDVRLVTLTGVGGSGKTRLGLHAAADLLDSFEDGVFFVALASIRDPSLVAAAAAQALGIQEGPGRPVADTLTDYLADRQILLVLDNFEQVLAAATLVAQLLKTCSRLKVLVTSRTLLRLRGEREFPVLPLTLPDPEEVVSADGVMTYSAVALFVQRALDAKHDFALTSENAPVIAEVCARLDGLPLAIELAAARARLLSPKAILARLEQRLPLLTGGPRDLPARHQTLRGTIGWSHDLLDEAQRRLFRRLGTFVGGFSLEAAEAVWESGRDPGVDVLDGVALLADQSLLRQHELADGEPRFSMLETIREFALERLEESPDADSVRRSHATYFVGLAEEADRQLTGPDQVRWLGRLELEHDNLRAAIRWSLVCAPELALRLAASLWLFWAIHGYFAEGRERLAACLGLPETRAHPFLHATALNGLGVLARKQGDYVAARALNEQSLAIHREIGDRRGTAHSLSNLGVVHEEQGDYETAAALHEEALAIRRALGDQWAIAMSLNNLGVVLEEQGDLQPARTLHEEAMAIRRQIGDYNGLGFSLINLGIVAEEQGDYAAARHYLEESLEVRRRLGDRWGVAYTLLSLAGVFLEQGDIARASTLHRESLKIMWELGDKWAIAACLEGLAAVATEQRDPTTGARLYGAALALREVIGAPLHPSERGSYEQHMARTRAQLDQAAFDAAWADGMGMRLELVVASALRQPGSA